MGGVVGCVVGGGWVGGVGVWLVGIELGGVGGGDMIGLVEMREVFVGGGFIMGSIVECFIRGEFWGVCLVGCGIWLGE